MIYMFSLASYGEGISGGDRIYIEFARRWMEKNPITIFVWEEGLRMCRRQNLTPGKNLEFQVSKLGVLGRMGFYICYFARIIEGVRLGLITKLRGSDYIIYSSSEFLMDVLPALLTKLRHPKTKWVATWFQTAPSPFQGFTEGSREEKYRLSALFYWLAQLLTKPLIVAFADYILVNNEEERKQFLRHNKGNRVIVVLGAVDNKRIGEWKLKNSKISKVYDAVFQGRFHAQKGVVELLDIWKRVLVKKPDAKLAMIGNGPLMNKVKSEIIKSKLGENIKLYGYVFDGPKKYKIFSESKVVVHPAFYDSGGMASAEAMAFGIPCVGFDLASYRSYYPKGMLKVETGNLEKFGEAILKLLQNNQLRSKTGKEAEEVIKRVWSWDYRAKEVLSKITQ